MSIFAISIFLSAFLLFQLQPMVGKYFLPWFGGTPAVWSTAMLFFQILLTGGYAYAYWLVKRPRQGWMHLTLITFSLATLVVHGFIWNSPIAPSINLRPKDIGFPTIKLFLLLMLSVGLPYFVLAANGTLMQVWFTRTFPKESYAKLYALSNLGSLLGLLVYPVLVEPSLTLRQQGWSWSVGFVLFSILAVILSLRFKSQKILAYSIHPEKPTNAVRFMWLILSGIASLLLLSVTNQLSQEVAVIPFLWILPLTMYLLSFIFSFSGAFWYDRRAYALLFSLASLALSYSLTHVGTLNVILQVVIYSIFLFLGAMICHVELYNLRPNADHLTGFYLMVSVGGALGGIFVNLIAPFIFTGYWEFYLAWLLIVILLVLFLLPRLLPTVEVRSKILGLSFFLATTVFALLLNHNGKELFDERNFYGVIQVRYWNSKEAVSMSHGITIHGIQFLSDRSRITTYYGKDSGIALLFQNYPRTKDGLRVGVLGLGVGSVAGYAEKNDDFRFYEINPIVIDLAEGQGGFFTNLKKSEAKVSVVSGDARIALESELALTGSDQFNILILDTYSSDSIPVHLVTQEAFQLYLSHLADNGVIAAHISNRYLDLQPVFWLLAKKYGLNIVRIDQPFGSQDGTLPSEWLLLSFDPTVLSKPEISSRAVNLDGYETSIRIWTDDYSNLFQILK